MKLKSIQWTREAIDRYIETVLPTKPKNAHNVKQHLLWWKKQFKHLTLDAIKPSLIAEKRDLLLVEPNSQGKKRCSTTAVRYLSSLSHVFTIVIKEWGWLSENPVHKISKPKVSNGRVRFLSDDERIRLLAACKESRCSILYLAVILALSTGMRYGEIMNLTRSDIDRNLGVITLTETKNGETRSLPLVGQPLELLKSHILAISKPSGKSNFCDFIINHFPIPHSKLTYLKNLNEKLSKAIESGALLHQKEMINKINETLLCPLIDYNNLIDKLGTIEEEEFQVYNKGGPWPKVTEHCCRAIGSVIRHFNNRLLSKLPSQL